MSKRTLLAYGKVLTPCLLGAVLSGAWASAALAQSGGPGRAASDPREDATQVEDVVVTASATGVNLRDAPASVSVVSREEIERQPVRSVGELLGRLPGVTGGLSPSGDLTKVNIRGLPSQYTLILVDGRRVGDAGAVSSGSSLARQDLNWIPPDMIERIEVVRGPMSSLYGSDAMGGVVNIVTRRIPQTWRGSANTSYTLPEESNRGESFQLGGTVMGPLTEQLGLRLGASYARSDPDELPLGDGRTDYAGATGIINKNLSGLLTFRPVEAHVFSLEGSWGLEDPVSPRTTIIGWDGQPTPQDAYGVETERTNVRLSHEGDWGFGTSRLDVYRIGFKNKDGDANPAWAYTGEQEELIVDGLFNFALNFAWEHKIAVGAQYREQEVTNTLNIGQLPTDPWGNPVSSATLKGDSWALFAEDQITLRENLFLTLGGRLDSHHRYGEHFTPRAYLVWHPTEAFTLRGGVSKGFRAPSLNENSGGAASQSRGGGCSSLIGFMDPTGYVFTNTGEGCWTVGNPDLKPEESTNYEIGLGYDRDGRAASVTYFHTDFDNKIETSPLGWAQGVWWVKQDNVDKARTRGLEFTGMTPLPHDVSLRVNATWIIEADNLTTGQRLITTPEWSGFASLDWRATERLNLALSAQYTGKQLGAGNSITGTTITDSHTTFDLTGAFDASEAVTLRAGVQNLFDEKITGNATGDGGFSGGYYSPGRRFFIGATSRF